MSIQNELNKIKNAVYGSEVRGAIHDGLKKGYEKADKAELNSNEIKEKYDEILMEWESNPNKDPEIIAARGNEPQLHNRLENVDRQLAQIVPKVFPFESDSESSEAIEAFVEEMNRKADKIGMTNTNFINPHGLRDENQVTTAKDMVLMGLNALTYKDLIKVWSRRNYIVNILGGGARELEVNTSFQETALNDHFYVGGGKTGSLSGLTQNLLSTTNAKFTNDWYIGVVLGNQDRYRGTRELHQIAHTSNVNKREVKYHNLNIANGNFDRGYDTWEAGSAGFPPLTTKEFYSYPQSLDVSSTGTSRQVRKDSSFSQGSKYYVSAMVKCTRYEAGTIGLQFTPSNPSTTIGLQRVTNGWEKVSGIVTADSGSGTLFAGGLQSANLDGYIDTVRMINLTTAYGAGNEPTKAEMDEVEWDDILSDMGAVVKVPTIESAFNADNLPLLFEKNGDRQGFPASMTKVMTAMVMLDYIEDLNMTIRVESSDIADGSGPPLYTGDTVTLEDALYLMMLPSSNSISNTVARHIGMIILRNRSVDHG